MSGSPRLVVRCPKILMGKALKTKRLNNMTLDLTDRCNSRCRTCDIWRRPLKNDLPVRKVADLFSDNLLDNIRSVSLTGGEPFLRRDLPDILSIIRKHDPRTRLSISTNGLLKSDALELLESFGAVNLALIISIDGIKKHDYVRGVSGAFRKTVNTIREIRKRYPGLDIETKFTITPWNYHEILDVYRLSGKLKTGFQIKMIENLRSYTNAIGYETNKRAFLFTESQKNEILKYLFALRNSLLKERRLSAAFFTHLIMQYLKNRDFRLRYCTCAFSSAFIMPDGEVYLCRSMNPIGNINSSSLGEIWNSEPAEKIRRIVRSGNCPKCISLYGFYN